MSKFNHQVGGMWREFDLATNPEFVRYWLTQHEHDAEWAHGHALFYAAMADGDAIGAHSIMVSELAKLAKVTMDDAAFDYGKDAPAELWADWFRDEEEGKQAHRDQIIDRVDRAEAA